MNVVLSDMESTPLEFMESLKRTTGMKWTAIDWQSNQMRTGKASEVHLISEVHFQAPLCCIP